MTDNPYKLHLGETRQAHIARLKEALLDCAADIPPETLASMGAPVPTELIFELLEYYPDMAEKMRGHVRFEEDPDFEPTPLRVQAAKILRNKLESRRS